MSKNDLRDAFSSTPLKEALEEKPVVEYTPDQVKLSELGIPLETIKTITLGWKSRNNGKKKIFDSNNKTFVNLTKGFWDYLLNTIYTVDLLKIDTSLLPEELEELTLKQIEIKGGSGTDELYKKIAELQKERDMLKEKAQKVVDSIEVMDYNQDTFDRLKWLYNYMGNLDFKRGYKATKGDIKKLQEIEALIK